MEKIYKKIINLIICINDHIGIFLKKHTCEFSIMIRDYKYKNLLDITFSYCLVGIYVSL